MNSYLGFGLPAGLASVLQPLLVSLLVLVPLDGGGDLGQGRLVGRRVKAASCNKYLNRQDRKNIWSEERRRSS